MSVGIEGWTFEDWESEYWESGYCGSGDEEVLCNGQPACANYIAKRVWLRVYELLPHAFNFETTDVTV